MYIVIQLFRDPSSHRNAYAKDFFRFFILLFPLIMIMVHTYNLF